MSKGLHSSSRATTTSKIRRVDSSTTRWRLQSSSSVKKDFSRKKEKNWKYEYIIRASFCCFGYHLWHFINSFGEYNEALYFKKFHDISGNILWNSMIFMAYHVISQSQWMKRKLFEWKIISFRVSQCVDISCFCFRCKIDILLHE